MNKQKKRLFIIGTGEILKKKENRLRTKIIEIIERFSLIEISLENLKDATIDELINLMFDILGERKVLFVFDNIDAYIDYESFIPISGFDKLLEITLNRRHNCKFIFTCRPFIKIAEVGFFQIELKGLKLEETYHLLDKYKINIKGEKRISLYNKLHKITNGHPLWLNLLGAQSVSGIEKLDEFITNISAHTNFNEDKLSRILSEKVLDALWESLNNKQQKLLRCLSELVKAEKAQNLIKIISDKLSANQCTRALNKLKLLNLVVTKTKDKNKEEIELHPLVRNYIIGKYPQKERNKYISIIIAYYTKITITLKEKLNNKEPLSFYENWTNKIELAINKGDFRLALSALEEISNPIILAGYSEEYIRISQLLFDSIDFESFYQEETGYFQNQIGCFVEISCEVSQFESSKKILEKYFSVIKNKGRDYIYYCGLQCTYFWHKFENQEAIKWGEKAMKLINNAKSEGLPSIEHSLNLAKRDSREVKYIKESLQYFSKNIPIEKLISNTVDENLTDQFYGNLGRCYFFLKDFDIAKKLFWKSFKLCYKDEYSKNFMNKGYISYWIGQVLEKECLYIEAFCFFSNCTYYWEKNSPHRAKKIKKELEILKEKIPETNKVFELNSEQIETRCENFVNKNINL